MSLEEEVLEIARETMTKLLDVVEARTIIFEESKRIYEYVKKIEGILDKCINNKCSKEDIEKMNKIRENLEKSLAEILSSKIKIRLHKELDSTIRTVIAEAIVVNKLLILLQKEYENRGRKQ